MNQIPERLVIASRGSRLALTQAEIVAALVRRAAPATEIDVVPVVTTGDRHADRPFASVGSKGIFVTEVEKAVLDGRADVAVHSAKDLTAELGESCAIVCVPARAEPSDVVVGGAGTTGEERLARLESGARVGTSSMRRRVLVAELRTDLDVVEFRGNLDTRLRKVGDGEVDVAILAAAGLERLGVTAERVALDPLRWVPAPGQGALAVEALSERSDLAALFEGLTDRAAAAEVACERAFATRLEGGCSVPLGCLARLDADRLTVTGMLGSPDGGQVLRDRISGPSSQATALGIELAEAILGGGGEDILADIRAVQAVEPSAP